MTNEPSIPATIAFALGARNWSHLRQIALSIATKQIMELHQYGRFSAGMELLNRVSKRWKLGNYVCAMQAHYPF
jgi:hypothetical protein